MSLLHTIQRGIASVYPTAKRWLYRFHGGVFPSYHKSMSERMPIRELALPKQLFLPIEQDGELLETQIQVGDRILKYQVVASPPKSEFIRSRAVPVHAPTSGTVIAIKDHPVAHPSGLKSRCIVIEPDGLDQAGDSPLQALTINDPSELKQQLREAGIVGMGGAGFPTYAKLPAESGKIHTLLINGAECEPFITCDDLLMQHYPQRVIQGALITAKALGAEKVICGIETNKPAAIEAMRSAAAGSIVEIKTVETVYPMGGQKQLTYELTGIEMPKGKHAVDLGLLMMNVATYAAIYQAVEEKKPLISRMVTVTGFGLRSPFNAEVLIGTPFNELVELAEPNQAIRYPLVMGGPMMGFEVLDNHVGVLKTTNCVLANPPQQQEMQMPCIRCGECMDACPVNLLPQQMYWHAQGHEYEKVEKLNIFDCIECGCCSYVCPSHIPLVQYYRHAKSEIKEIHAEQKAVELAKQRHEFKLARIEREKQEREERLRQKKEAVKKQMASEDSSKPSSKKSSDSAKQPNAAQAAAARAAAAKKSAAQKASQANVSVQTEPAEDDLANLPPARRKAIEAARKAAQGKKTPSTKGASASPENRTKTEAESTKDPKASAKAAAARAAAARAAAKKAAQQTDDSEQAESKTLQMDQQTQTVKKDSRAAAKAAAAKAAARKKAQQQASEQGKTAKNEVAKPDATPNELQAVDLTETSAHTSPALEKEQQRKLAVEKARQAALARKQAQKQQALEQDAEQQTKQDAAQSLTDQPVVDKRAAAVEAARKRAAARKAQQQSNAEQGGDS
ncbi:electron transport complex subunit RsxC [Thiomicrorhabdus sp.]|uniref:electron transport complex subunit RsxC n=1 Tax=Thiomicrorhabdus sp. TaxID=2039724 RepID=UPI0029C615B7|nr:electron transport complex subunit RsxC [Thiomicrorhabdus sp.]